MKLTYWILALVITLGVGHIAAQAGTEDQPPSAGISAADLKRAAAGAWQCPGMHAEWLDETTVHCLKESL